MPYPRIRLFPLAVPDSVERLAERGVSRILGAVEWVSRAIAVDALLAEERARREREVARAKAPPLPCGHTVADLDATGDVTVCTACIRKCVGARRQAGVRAS